MTDETSDPHHDKQPEQEEVVQSIRTQGPQPPMGSDEVNEDVASDETADEKPDEQRDPGIGGYGGRSPEKHMPKVVSEPDTQDDPKPHGGGAPGTRGGEDASS